MVAKILTSEVPFTSVNDQIYIDIDPVSFRVIVSILQGITTEAELTHISDRELVLLVATARYLLCRELTERLRKFQDERGSRISQLLLENNVLKSTVAEMNNSSEIKVGNGISSLMPLTKIACSSPRWTASQNCPCGNIALLIGSTFKVKEGKIHCDSCCTDTIATYSNTATTETLTSVKDLVSAVQQMTDRK
jgi:hypothetical protein